MKLLNHLIAVCFVMLNFSSIASPVLNAPLETAILQEKYVDALRLSNFRLQQLSAEQTDSLSYYVYQTAACLFQLRSTKAMEKLLLKVTENPTKINSYYLSKIQFIQLQYLKEKGDLQQPEETLQQAIATNIYPDIKNDYSLLLASYYLSVNKIEAAENLYRKIFLLNNSTTIQKAAAGNGIGASFAYNSKYDSAQIYYQKAIGIFAKIFNKKHTRIAQVKFNLALIDNNYGNFHASEKILLADLSSYRAVFGDQHIRTAETYGTLGSVYMLQDNYEKALYYIIKERDILIQLYGKKHADLAYSYLNAGRIHISINDYTTAEQEIRAGIEVLKNAGKTNTNTYTQLGIELAKILIEKKEYKNAQSLLEKLLQQENMEDEYKADVYLQLGDIYSTQKKYTVAENYFFYFDKIYNTVYGDKNIYSVDANLFLSNNFLQKGALSDALKYAETAYQKTIKNKLTIFPYEQWRCRLQTMYCIKEQLKQPPYRNGQIVKHIETIKDILSDAKRIKQTYYSNGSQIQISQKMAELNQLGIYFLTHFYKQPDTYFINNLLFFSENNKANLLRSKISNDASNDFLPKEKKEQSEIIVNRLNYFISLNENQEEMPFIINDSILWYQDKYERFTKSIEKEYPKIYRIKYEEQPVTVRKIQQNIPEQCSLLEYGNDGENYYCLSVSKNKITYKQCGNKHYLDSLIAQYQQSIIDKKIDQNTGALLYEKLLPQYKTFHLLLSPDANIHQVAFDALPTNNNHEFLIQKHTTQFIFSATTYFNPIRSDNSKKVISFFPDFIQSEYAALDHKKEHAALKLFPAYEVYYKEKAVKEKFIEKVRKAGIIHIATHLITDTISPLRSYLVFQPNRDYKLSISDIWKLNANVQLVTLASCQSNYGKQQSGEGTQNFAWAFYYAGARNILSTQWNASNQSTAKIINAFYKHLRNGKSKQDALRLAKLDYLQSTDAIGVQPFYWSNFHLYGDSNALQIIPHCFVKFWYIPIVLFLFVYFSTSYFIKVFKKKRYGFF